MQFLFLFSQGRTDAQACAIVGICPASYYKYRNENPRFAELCDQAKDIVDDAVESALLKMAIGYKMPAVKISYDSDLKCHVTEEYEKVVGPSEAAAKMWLLNRRRHRWKHDDEEKPRDITISMAYDPAKRIEKKVKSIPSKPAVIEATATDRSLTDGKDGKGKK